MRYVDLMGGRKPHLLVRTVNNLGAETLVEYASSAKFYLQDKAAGRPCVTRLPFPVHVVERAQTNDRVGGNRFVTRYSYHHGYFDGVEREFRGFGMVEQTDTEEFASLSAGGEFPSASNVEEASHVPPVLTRTWFHTGAHLGRDHVSDYFAGLVDGDNRGEYYRKPGLGDEQARALLLDDTVLPDGLSPGRPHHPLRAEPHPECATEAAHRARSHALPPRRHCLAAARSAPTTRAAHPPLRLPPQQRPGRLDQQRLGSPVAGLADPAAVLLLA